MKEIEIKKAVRKAYGVIAAGSGSCCAPKESCCGPASTCVKSISEGLGYSPEELQSIPEGADCGLGCGNPVAIASLKEGEIVLDLGSGPGMDCFLAAQRVGAKGRIIGVDMTLEMIEKARENAERGGYENVEFRLGEIENLPVADSSVDVVISNCVINLSPDKKRVFQEVYRVLKPGGRIMISDIVLTKELPEAVAASIDAYIGCIAGAVVHDVYLESMRSSGFDDITVIEETAFPLDACLDIPETDAGLEKSHLSREAVEGIASSIRSVRISGLKRKP